MPNTPANDYDILEDERPSVRDRLGDNPVGVLIGGFVVGAALGALIPASSRERRALQPVGAKAADAARSAVGQAGEAIETARGKLGDITKEVAGEVSAKVSDAVASLKDGAKA